MARKKSKCLGFMVNDKCFICGTNVFWGLPLTYRDIIIHTTSKVTMLIAKYRRKSWFIGVKVSGKTICRKCLELLIALEGYYDCYYDSLVGNNEAVEIVKAILKNRQLQDEAMKFLVKGSYFPRYFVEKIKREFLKAG